MKGIITSDDILGKDVVDIDGEIIGVVQQLQIDKHSKQIVGLLVDQGFMKPDLFVGYKFVKNLGVDTIFLNTSPRPKIKGLEVYDSLGKKIGFVTDVIEAEGMMSGILMKKNSMAKDCFVKNKYIKTIGFSMILRTSEEQLPKLAVKKTDQGLQFLT